MDRIKTIDNAKFITIILVVFGHMSFPDEVIRFIFSFHMPMFFFLSGVLFSKKRLSLSTTSFVCDALRRYMLPYVFFSAILFCHYFVYSLFQKYGNMTVDFGKLFGNFAIGWFSVYWFLTCLFCTSIMFYFLRKFLSKTLVVFIGFATLVISSYFWVDTIGYACFPASCIALFYFAIGNAISGFVKKYDSAKLPEIPFVGGVLILILVWIIAPFNSNFAMAEMYLGKFYLAYVPLSILGIVGVLIISKYIPTCSLTDWIGKNTLVIFALHLIFISWTRAILKFGVGINYPPKDLLVLIICNIICLITSIIGAYFAKRIFVKLNLPF